MSAEIHEPLDSHNWVMSDKSVRRIAMRIDLGDEGKNSTHFPILIGVQDDAFQVQILVSDGLTFGQRQPSKPGSQAL